MTDLLEYKQRARDIKLEKYKTQVQQKKDDVAFNAILSEAAIDEGLMKRIEQAETDERNLYSLPQFAPENMSQKQLLNEALQYEDWDKIRSMDTQQQTELVKSQRAQRTDKGYALIPVDKKRLATGAYDAEGNPVFNGPTVRAANSVYLAKTMGTDIKRGATVYDSMVKLLWGDKEPTDIRPMGKLIRKWYSDKTLISQGIDPAVYRAARKYAAGDEKIEWDIVLANLSEERKDLLINYVSALSSPKARGFLGKTGEILRRSAASSAKTITHETVRLHPEESDITRQFREQETSKFKEKNQGREPFGIEALEVNERGAKEARQMSVYSSKLQQAEHANDPIESENLLGKFWYGTLGILPDAVASIATTAVSGTPLGGAYYWYNLIASGNYTDMKDMGFDDNTAANAARITALPEAAINSLQISQFANISEAAKKKAVFKARQGLMNYLGGKIKGGIATLGKEYLEEAAESAVAVTGKIIADVLTEDNPDIDWYSQIIRPEMDELKAAFFAFPGLIAGGKVLEMSAEAKMVRSIMKTNPGLDKPTARAAVYNLKNDTISTLKEQIKNGEDAQSKPLMPFTPAQIAEQTADVQGRLAALESQNLTESYIYDYNMRRFKVLQEGGNRDALAELESSYDITEEHKNEFGSIETKDLSESLETADPQTRTAIEAELEQRGETEKPHEKFGKMASAEYQTAVVDTLNEVLAANGLEADIKITDKTTQSDEVQGQQGARPKGAAYMDGSGKRVIELAFMYNEQGKVADVVTAGHEAYHTLAGMLDAAELEAIKAEYGNNEEDHAEAFGKFLSEKKQAEQTGAVQKVFLKIIEKLKAIWKSIKNKGLTADDVFKGITEGKLEGRGPNLEQGKEVKFQVEGGKSRVDGLFERDVEADTQTIMKIFDAVKKDGGEIGGDIFRTLEKRTAALESPLDREAVLADIKEAKELYDNRGQNGQTVKDAIAAMVKAEASVRKAAWYQDNRPQAHTWQERYINRMLNYWGDIKHQTGNLLASMSTTMGDISMDIKREVRAVFHRQMMRSAEMKNQADPMLAEMNQLRKKSPEDYRDLNFALFNGDFTKAEKIINKYNMQTEYAAVKSMLDVIMAMSNAVGMEVEKWGGTRGYWPRKIKDVQGFNRFTRGLEDWSIIEKAINDKEKKIHRTLTEDERASLANSILRGFRVGGLMLARPGYARERSVEMVDKMFADYYMSPEESMIHHIVEANQKISVREFFGRETQELVKLRAEKSRLLTRLNKLSGKTSGKVWSIKEGWKELGEEDYKEHISKSWKRLEEISGQIETMNGKRIEESVGWYVNNAIMNKKIKADKESQISDLLVGAFDQKGLHGTIKRISNLNYMTTLGQPTNALTQIKELARAFYTSPRFAASEMVKTLLDKTDIKLEDIGIESVGEEFTSSNTSKMTNFVLDSVSFNWMDMLGKKTYINTVLSKYRGLAQKLTIKDAEEMLAGAKTKSIFYKRIEDVFADKAPDVIEEIRAGEITDNIKLLLFNELSDIQPVSVIELPLAYARGGNGRIFYSMKSYTLKQLDWNRREIFRKMKDPKTAVEGFTNLIKWTFWLSVFGVGVDGLKDFILGKDDFDPGDSFVDNMLQQVFWSKYKSYQMRYKGFGGAMMETILPPTKTADTLTNSREGDWVRNIPYGELYYWWVVKDKKKRGW